MIVKYNLCLEFINGSDLFFYLGSMVVFSFFWVYGYIRLSFVILKFKGGDDLL